MKDWESYARQFHTLRERGPEFAQRTMANVAETAQLTPAELPAGPWIDVGAGTGRLSGGLAEYWDRDVIALEPQSAMIADRERHARVRWVQGSAVDPPFALGSAAGVFLHLVLHQIDDWQLALQRLVAVLVDGGILAIRTGNPDRIPEDEDSGFFPRLNGLVRERLLPVEALTQALNRCGLAAQAREFKTTRRISRDDYIASIENKMLSTLRELTDTEFQEGLTKLLEKYPPTVDYVEQTRHALFLVGRR